MVIINVSTFCERHSEERNTSGIWVWLNNFVCLISQLNVEIICRNCCIVKFGCLGWGEILFRDFTGYNSLQMYDIFCSRFVTQNKILQTDFAEIIMSLFLATTVDIIFSSNIGRKI